MVNLKIKKWNIFHLENAKSKFFASNALRLGLNLSSKWISWLLIPIRSFVNGWILSAILKKIMLETINNKQIFLLFYAAIVVFYFVAVNSKKTRKNTISYDESKKFKLSNFIIDCQLFENLIQINIIPWLFRLLWCSSCLFCVCHSWFWFSVHYLSILFWVLCGSLNIIFRHAWEVSKKTLKLFHVLLWATLKQNKNKK